MNRQIVVSKKAIAIASSRQLPEYLTKDQVQKLFETKTIAKKERNKLLLSVMWQTGARISEVLSIKVKNIDFYGKTIKLTNLKRKNQTWKIIPIKDSLVGQLGVYVASNKLSPEDKLFPITRYRADQIIRQAAKEAGLPPKLRHCHILRHSFAVHCLRSGVPITTVQRWLGHSSILNTLVYTQITAEESAVFMQNVEF